MIDIHSHVIYGVDDGPSTIKDSIRMVLEAERLGVSTIIATPHYHKDVYEAEKATEHFRELLLRVQDCDIKLLMGFEVFIDSTLSGITELKDKYTLNKSEYLLFELPFDIMPSNLSNIILKLHMMNLVPIIAHPERNRYFHKNFQNFAELMEAGCLIQIDAASILGLFGQSTKKFAKYLIKSNLAHFVASDAHCPEDYIERCKAAYMKVEKWAGKEYADALFTKNQKMILEI